MWSVVWSFVGRWSVVGGRLVVGTWSVFGGFEETPILVALYPIHYIRWLYAIFTYKTSSSTSF